MTVVPLSFIRKRDALIAHTLLICAAMITVANPFLPTRLHDRKNPQKSIRSNCPYRRSTVSGSL